MCDTKFQKKALLFAYDNVIIKLFSKQDIAPRFNIAFLILFVWCFDGY